MDGDESSATKPGSENRAAPTDGGAAPAPPPPDRTPPVLSFDGLDAFTEPDWIALSASDPGGGLASVQVRLFGAPPAEPWTQRITIEDGAQTIAHRWRPPAYEGYALLTARAEDRAGNVTDAYRWLQKAPRASAMTATGARVQARANASLTGDPNLLRRAADRLNRALNASIILPRPIGEVPGHRLSLVALKHASPAVRLVWRSDAVRVYATLADIRATVAVRGWIDRDVNVRGGLLAEFPIAFSRASERASLSFDVPSVRLQPFSVDVLGLTSTVRRRVTQTLWTRAYNASVVLNTAVQGMLSRGPSHRFRIGLPGGDVVLPMRLDSWKADATGLSSQWLLETPTQRIEMPPHRCPDLADATPPPPHFEADLPISEVIAAAMVLWRRIAESGPWRLELPMATATVQIGRTPRWLGCAQPGQPLQFFQIAGISIHTRIGKGLISLSGRAEAGLVVAVQTRTHQGRAQARVIPHWVWSDAPLVQRALTARLQALETWRDLPVIKLPEDLTLRVTRVTPHGDTLRVEGMLQ